MSQPTGRFNSPRAWIQMEPYACQVRFHGTQARGQNQNVTCKCVPCAHPKWPFVEGLYCRKSGDMQGPQPFKMLVALVPTCSWSIVCWQFQTDSNPLRGIQVDCFGNLTLVVSGNQRERAPKKMCVCVCRKLLNQHVFKQILQSICG